MKQSFKETLHLIKADMQHRCRYENKTLNTVQVIKFLLNSAALSTIIYRWQIFCYCHHLSFFASLLRFINGLLFTVEIDSRTEIGGGFFMMHANFICIGANVKIGQNCILAHQNAICASPFFTAESPPSAQGPTLGNNAIIGGGATISGNIVLGNNVQVSMNAAVDVSYADDAVLFGVPARNMTKTVVDAAA